MPVEDSSLRLAMHGRKPYDRPETFASAERRVYQVLERLQQQQQQQEPSASTSASGGLLQHTPHPGSLPHHGAVDHGLDAHIEPELQQGELDLVAAAAAAAAESHHHHHQHQQQQQQQQHHHAQPPPSHQQPALHLSPDVTHEVVGALKALPEIFQYTKNLESRIEQLEDAWGHGMRQERLMELIQGNQEFIAFVKECAGNQRPSETSPSLGGPSDPTSLMRHKATRKTKDTTLLNHVHYQVKRLVGMKCRLAKSHVGVFDDGLLEDCMWPVPLLSGQQQQEIALDDGSTRIVWRPDWDRVREPEWQTFIDVVTDSVIERWDDMPGKPAQPCPPRGIIAEAVLKYCKSIKVKAGLGPSRAEDGGPALKVWQKRKANQTSTARWKMFDASVLNECKDREVYRMLCQVCFTPTFFPVDDPMARRYPELDDYVDSQTGQATRLDAWETYRQYSLDGNEQLARGAIEICWPTWMSPRAIYAASILDVDAAAQHVDQRSWLTRWCSPTAFWPETTLDHRQLAPPSSTDPLVPNTSDPAKYVIYRSMVNPGYLNQVKTQDPQVYARIYPDPAPSPTDNELSDLVDLMQGMARQGDRAKAARLRPPVVDASTASIENADPEGGEQVEEPVLTEDELRAKAVEYLALRLVAAGFGE